MVSEYSISAYHRAGKGPAASQATMVTKEGKELEKFKSDCTNKFDYRVTSGEIDILSEMQPLIVPPRNELMVRVQARTVVRILEQ